MNKLLLLFTFLSLPFLLSAQSLTHSRQTSYYTYIFQLEDKEARRIYRKDLSVVDDSYFHTAVDSFPTGKDYPKALPYGYYLFTYADGGDLVYELKMVDNIRVQVLNNKVDLALLVTDTAGKAIEQATVHLGSKQIPFNKKAGSYLLKKTSRKGVVTVRYQDFTSYHLIDTRNKQPLLRKVKNRIVYTRPVYWVWKPFRDIVQSIRYGYPEGFVRKMAGIINPLEFRDYANIYRGYIAFNKPLYMPRDTVKFKAFILKRRGKPIDDILQVVLNTPQGRKILTRLKPYTKGGYTYEFVLHDSLQLPLDRNYGIALEKTTYRPVMYGSFKLEAYELSSNTFALRSDKITHHTGSPLSVYVQGKDENELPLADAMVQLTVTPAQVINFNGIQAFVKDTLWQHQQKLDPLGETKIIVPDSIFPPLSVEYTIHAVFLNASNERHYHSLKAQYIHSPQEIKFSVKKDTLVVEYLVAGKAQQANAQLTTWIKGQEKPQITSVDIPYKQALNPYAFRYDCRVDSLKKTLFVNDEESLLQCYSHRTADSLFIWVENPRKLPFYYTIYRKNKPIGRGTGGTLNFASKVTTPANYFISLQYPWAGSIQEQEFSIPFQMNKLNITVNQPTVVSPGQQAAISIQVTDFQGAPAKNVDVTAYAITRKFNNAYVPELPYMGNGYRGRKALHEFTLGDKFTEKSGAVLPLDWPYWNREMGLDSIAYYQFLYPSTGLFKQYISTADSLTQIAPFVVQGGRIVPVYLIYLDNRLIYYRDADVVQRYSFEAGSGYHSLKIRTADNIISIDSIRLQAKLKLVLSVNGEASHPDITMEKVKKEYSQQEQQVLNRYVMHVQYLPGKEAYLKQGSFIQPLSYRLSNYHTHTLITGVYTPSPMQFVLREGFTTNFTFEPLYAYEFGKELLKMRSLHPQNFYKYRLYPQYQSIRPHFAEQPYQLKEIDSLWAWQKEAELAIGNKLSYAITTTKDFGKLVIHTMALPDSAVKRIKALLLFREDDPNFLRIYPAKTNILHQLEPGTYKVVLLLYFNYFIETAYFPVQAGGSNYINIRNISIQAPNEFSRKAAGALQKESYSLQQEKKNLQEVKENFYNTYNISPTGNFTQQVTGQVTDTDGVALPGVNVVVKGTTIGTITDKDGFYQLYVPSNAVLVFSFIGYVTDEVLVGSKPVIDAQLQADVKALSEVVVVGYASQRRQSLTASVATATPLQGRIAGVQVADSIDSRGVPSLDASNPPLIILNGVPFNGTLADIDPAFITNTQVLKGEAAIALYGARATNGVLLITTSLVSVVNRADSSAALLQIPGDNAGSHSLRRNFSDYAYWQPRLKTDTEGKATFTVTFPDDVTNWRTFVLAMDHQKRSGTVESSIKSFKPVVSTLAVPRFLIEGDSSLVIGKTGNYTSDTLVISTNFMVNGEKKNLQQRKVIHSAIDSLLLAATATDSVEVSYVSTQEGGLEDGEMRVVPVFPKGTQETKGIFLNLDADTTLTLNFDPSLGKVKVFVQGDMLQVLLDEIEQIKKYEYFCNEQAASKLIALLLEKKIRTTLGENFTHERDILKLINKLEAAQRKDGSWGWWPDSSPLMWVSLHVAEALLSAEKAGYRVKYNKQALQDHLIFELESQKASNKLRCLQLLKTFNAKADYRRYTEILAKDTTLSLQEQLQLIEILQQSALPYSLDSLNKYKQQTMTGGMYIANNVTKTDYDLTDNPITHTIIAYRILRAKGGYEQDLQAMRRYFLERRSTGYWRNTYESALILSTILQDILTGKDLPPSTLSFGGAWQANTTTFPYQAQFTPGQALTIRKTGKRPVYFTAYQEYWNQAPQASEKDFVVQSYLEGNKTELVELKAGQPVKLLVEVEVKQEADYLMLEVPVPAGCSYEDKRTNYTLEVHREYFMHKASIFCQQLKKGKYTFTVNILPRYNGVYTLNPAKAQLMYFPVFYGRNEVKKVKVHQ